MSDLLSVFRPVDGFCYLACITSASSLRLFIYLSICFFFFFFSACLASLLYLRTGKKDIKFVDCVAEVSIVECPQVKVKNRGEMRVYKKQKVTKRRKLQSKTREGRKMDWKSRGCRRKIGRESEIRLCGKFQFWLTGESYSRDFSITSRRLFCVVFGLQKKKKKKKGES